MDYPTLLMATDVSPIAPGGTQFGWVSGSLASLAASATANCLFDLGPNWNRYAELQIIIKPAGPSSGLSNVFLGSRDDAVAAISFDRQLGPRYGSGANGGAFAASISASAGFNVRPMGRFLVVRATNADAVNAQGAAQVTVAAYGV